MSMRSSKDRYGSLAIAFHWLSAITILALLVLGFRAAGTPDPVMKANLLRLHVPLGLFILVITILRLGWWALDRRPDRVAGMLSWQSVSERLVHSLLYGTVLVIGLSGIGMMIQSGAGAILFGSSTQLLPNFWDYVPRRPHGLAAFVLIALVGVHVAAALYHQFIKRDRLLARMGLGRVPG